MQSTRRGGELFSCSACIFSRCAQKLPPNHLKGGFPFETPHPFASAPPLACGAGACHALRARAGRGDRRRLHLGIPVYAPLIFRIRSELEGVYISAVPPAYQAELCIGSRVLRRGDILPAAALEKLKLRPVCLGEADCELVYCPIERRDARRRRDGQPAHPLRHEYRAGLRGWNAGNL